MEARSAPKVSVTTLQGRTAVTVTLDGDDLSRVDALILAAHACQGAAEEAMADEWATATEAEQRMAVEVTR